MSPVPFQRKNFNVNIFLLLFILFTRCQRTEWEGSRHILFEVNTRLFRVGAPPCLTLPVLLSTASHNTRTHSPPVPTPPHYSPR